ncbi:MAG: MlaD family protein [Campylobacteraceae bacterium]
MEQKSNYTLVGIFVFVFFLGILGAFVWMQKYADDVTYNFYRIDTKDSVAGLNEKAAVKVNGITVGEVSKLMLNEKNSEEVSIIVKIRSDVPIKEDTRASIQLQGITGLSFVQLSGGTQNATILKTSDDPEKYGVIQSSTSILERVDKSLTTIMDKTSDVITQINSLMRQENIENIDKILANVADITSSLADTARDLDKRVDTLDHVFKNAIELEDSLKVAANELTQMSVSIKNTATSVDTLVKNIDTKVEGGKFDLDTIIEYNLIPLKNMADEAGVLIWQLRQAVENFNQSPSDILFKSGKIEPGPGE